MSTAALERPLDKLKAALKPKPAKKEKTPVVEVPGLRPIILKLAEAKIATKDAEAYEKLLGADAVALAEPFRVDLSRKRGECLSSMECDGLTYIHQSRYSTIKDASDEDLRKWAKNRDAALASGEEFTDQKPPSLDEQETELKALCDEYGVCFETYFVEQMTVSVDVNKLTPEQLEQLSGMDPEGFRSLKVSKAFHADRTLKPEIAEMAVKAKLTPVQYFRM